MAMLDTYEAMGVEVIKLEVEYPIFTPAFHDWLAANPPPALQPIHRHGRQLHRRPELLLQPSRDGDPVARAGPVDRAQHAIHGLFADAADGLLRRDADRRDSGDAPAVHDERSAEAALVVSQLAPDYYTILEEPTTQNDNFGYFPGQRPAIRAERVARLRPGGRGGDRGRLRPARRRCSEQAAGTWDDAAYIQLFAPLPELDYIDFHMYPLETIGAGASSRTRSTGPTTCAASTRRRT